MTVTAPDPAVFAAACAADGEMRLAVHYWTGGLRLGIAGSTHTEMADVGHFPMQENPEVFIRYLLPILNQIEARAN
ncbi:MAG: hypothetical protein OXG67_11500 [bacterium]|nr:hypothetical protein [bacterium]MCY3891298.1 hypothetical protein [bacterium]